jgi:hypothetical protein
LASNILFTAFNVCSEAFLEEKRRDFFGERNIFWFWSKEGVFFGGESAAVGKKHALWQKKGGGSNRLIIHV